MIKKMKPFIWGLLAILVCLLLALLLLLAERGAEGALITNYPKALWYMLTTLTTVGYGDTYPVTVMGKIIGALFQLASLGLLVFLFGLLISAFRGRFLPRFRIRRAGGKDAYIYSSASPAALALSANLKKEQPDAVQIFAGQSERSEKSLPGLSVPFTPEEILALRKKNQKNAVFCIGEDPLENEELAASLLDQPCRIFCMTDHEIDKLPASMTLFDQDTCLARLYWHEHPLRGREEHIVLIGEGKAAEALLLHGLLNNVTDPESAVRYDVFGEFGDFRRNHVALKDGNPVSLNDGSHDEIWFHDEPWNQNAELLAEADRIIICYQAERDAADLTASLLKHFPVNGAVHVRLSVPDEVVTAFGRDEEIFTPELVMRTGLDRTARRMNEIYRERTGSGASWEELSGFARRSNLASADHLEVKVRWLLGDEADGSLSKEQCAKAYQVFENADPVLRDQCRRIEHTRWVRYHLLNNWTYAPERNNEKRQHPLILPFDELSPEEQAKDDYGWELLKELSH